MKKIISIILAALCLISMSGCTASKSNDQNAVTFYYVRSAFQYHGEDNVIVAETRDLSGSRWNLDYLLMLYMLGPLSEELSAPYPGKTELLSIQYGDEVLDITLSGLDNIIHDSRFALGSACLAMTLFELTEYDTVRIFSGERSIVLDRNDILLNDGISSASETTKETQ